MSDVGQIDDRPKTPRRRIRISLRILLLLLTAICVLCALFAARLERADRQSAAVAYLRSSIAVIDYDFQVDEDGALTGGDPPVPQWMLRPLGIDFWSDVVAVSIVRHYDRDESPAIIEALEELPALRDLNVQTIETTNDDLRRLEAHTQLRSLNLGYRSRVDDAGLKHLRGFTRLQWLNLNGTAVTDSGMTHLAKLENLITLDLSETQLTDEGLVEFNACQRLEFLFIQNTQVTEAGVAAFKRRWPNCHVAWQATSED